MYIYIHIVLANRLDLKLVLSNFLLTPLPQLINGCLQAAVELAGKVSFQGTSVMQGKCLAKGPVNIHMILTDSVPGAHTEGALRPLPRPQNCEVMLYVNLTTSSVTMNKSAQ